MSLYVNLVTRILTSDECRSMKADYKKIAAVERIQQLQVQQTELGKQINTYSSLADKPAKTGNDSTLTAPLTNQLIEQFTVSGPEDTIWFRFKSGLGPIG